VTVYPEPETGHPEPAQHPTPSSAWPMVVAGGLTATFFGLVTWIPAFSVLGVVTLVGGIVGWVKELTDGS
jgi:hypothetical protein